MVVKVVVKKEAFPFKPGADQYCTLKKILDPEKCQVKNCGDNELYTVNINHIVGVDFDGNLTILFQQTGRKFTDIKKEWLDGGDDDDGDVLVDTPVDA